MNHRRVRPTPFLLMMLGALPMLAQDQFVLNDTTFLQRDTVGPYHAVFIAAAGDTARYNKVAGPIADLYEHKWVMSQRKALDDMGKKSPGVRSTESFPRRDWVRAVRWQGVYYLYHPSDAINHFRIQQFPRLIITDEVDGPLAHVVVDLPVADKSIPVVNYPCVSLVSHAFDPKHDTLDVSLHQLDPTSEVTLWTFTDAGGDVRYELMVPRKSAYLLPLIVNYSPAQKAREFQFDAVDAGFLKR